MKTLNEIKDEIALKHYGKNFVELIVNDLFAMAFFVCDLSAKEYASQFIDAAAESVEFEYTAYGKGNDKDWEDFTSTSGEWFRVDKQSILKLKDQLK